MKSLTQYVIFLTIVISSFWITHILCHDHPSPPAGIFSGAGNYRDQLRKMQSFKASFLRRDSVSISPTSISPAGDFPPASSPAPAPAVTHNPHVYRVTTYGADPSGTTDSTESLLEAISDALKGPSDGYLMEGIVNLGGAHIDLEGGNYLITRPLKFPITSRGNLVIHGGTIKASDDFPTDAYLIDLSSSSSSSNSGYSFEFITMRDLLLDSNYRGGGIRVLNSLRTSIDNCYIAHFSSDGILIQGGHETYVRSSFLGQHITAGGDHGERNFSGTGITLAGNDNAITDVVIFSAAVGISVVGQANIISGVHCYNKATGFGGIGIYLRLPGLTQTRIVNSYLDYTSIVAEDPVQLLISGSFFLGDANIIFKSVTGLINGVSVIGNMFSGSNKGIAIVQLDEASGPFREIDQVVVDGNNVKGMSIRATVARGSVQGHGTSWTVDLSPILLFPNLINHVQYSLATNVSSFPNHALRNSSNNRVLIESDVVIHATVYVAVDQGVSSFS